MALVVKNPPVNVGDTRDVGLIPGLGRPDGGGNRSPLQCSCLEKSMDRGAWRATVHGIARSRHDWAHSMDGLKLKRNGLVIQTEHSSKHHRSTHHHPASHLGQWLERKVAHAPALSSHLPQVQGACDAQASHLDLFNTLVLTQKLSHWFLTSPRGLRVKGVEKCDKRGRGRREIYTKRLSFVSLLSLLGKDEEKLQ